jgi:hypothetical protein
MRLRNILSSDRLERRITVAASDSIDGRSHIHGLQLGTSRRIQASAQRNLHCHQQRMLLPARLCRNATERPNRMGNATRTQSEWIVVRG